MQEKGQPGGSAARWGPLFGARARDWADTWEGPEGYGTHIYEHILERAKIGSGTGVLDCGCGAGRFARMAADRGASVAGIDAAQELIDIAAERTPDGDFRVGDVEALPWPDRSFDVVAGINVFQFAADKEKALREARRVSRGVVVVVIPSRASESGIRAVYAPVIPLYPPAALQSLKESGIFALSEPGRLDEVIGAASLVVQEDDEIETPIRFYDVDAALRAFIGAGPTAIAISHSGEPAVAHALREGLLPFAGTNGQVALQGWYRVVLARG